MKRRTYLSVPLLFIVRFGSAYLATTYLGSATTVTRFTAELSITGDLRTCGVNTPLLAPLQESSPVYASDGLGPIDRVCEDGTTNIASMHAVAEGHAGTPPTIAAVASSTGPGATAIAEAHFDDFAIIRPPFNSTVLDATFSITSDYSLDLSLPTLSSTGGASVALTLPLYAFKQQQLTNTGSLSGVLDTGDITVVGCPCAVEILGSVTVRGSNGGGGSAKDPFTINLPPGWTYTLASEEQAGAVAPAPEPGTLSTILAVLAAVAVIRIRRNGRRVGDPALGGRAATSSRVDGE
jgi:hypothetical protein